MFGLGYKLGSRRRLSSKVTVRTGGLMLIEWYPKQLSALGVAATRENKFEGSSVAGLNVSSIGGSAKVFHGDKDDCQN